MQQLPFNLAWFSQIQLQEYSDLPLSSGSLSLITQIPIAIVEGLLTVIFYNLISENASERERVYSYEKHKNLLLLAAIVVSIVGAFLFAPKGVEYSGTDDAAENAISTIQKDYKPWFSPLFEPPGSEVELTLYPTR